VLETEGMSYEYLRLKMDTKGSFNCLFINRPADATKGYLLDELFLSKKYFYSILKLFTGLAMAALMD
jgi:hypothetical protein